VEKPYSEMLEKPAIQDSAILACLRDAYGLTVERVDFLPLGADRNTAVYRAVAADATSYFVKLRSGIFDEMTLIVPGLLHDRGLRQVIAPIPARSQRLWTTLDDFWLAVFSFIEGRNGYEIDLLDQHWVDFGQALKALHTTGLTPALAERIRREDYSGAYRATVRRFLTLVEDTPCGDPVAAETAAFVMSKQDEIGALVNRAETLASVLRARPLPLVLCHADIHAANILIDGSGRFYIVDWDTLTLAPKERDLMFVGGGQFLNKRSAAEEEALFYRGYGPMRADPVALAYYRNERIVQDIAEFCEQILLTADGGDDRARGLYFLKSQFLPGNVVEIATRSEAHLPPAR
jgi:spectinomycin phosphotransferase